MKLLLGKLLATATVIIAVSAGVANAETLRLLTWGSYSKLSNPKLPWRRRFRTMRKW